MHEYTVRTSYVAVVLAMYMYYGGILTRVISTIRLGTRVPQSICLAVTTRVGALEVHTRVSARL